ncbi:hypothetical protein CFP56_016032 [Quercus suber]|uniref:Uncharacterized protein n=1 Tax=Quercus suber TaxID=58331 RepID=A0AAW0KR28_QUESU
MKIIIVLLEEYLLLSSSSPQAYWFLSSLKEILDIWSSGEEILRYQYLSSPKFQPKYVKFRPAQGQCDY